MAFGISLMKPPLLDSRYQQYQRSANPQAPVLKYHRQYQLHPEYVISLFLALEILKKLLTKI
jgi:hypothetical protein